MEKNTKNATENCGFTLVELVVVLAVLGVLAAVAVPTLTGFIDRGKNAKKIAECTACVAAAQAISDMRAEAGQKWPYVTTADEKSIFDMADIAEENGKLLTLTLEDGGPTVTELIYCSGEAKEGVRYKGGQFEMVPVTLPAA